MKRVLKKRKSVVCSCKRKQPQKDRAKYGTCRCDGYSFCWSVGLVLSNALYQYITDAKQIIIREDFDIIEKHADAIRDYAEADSMDIGDDDINVRWNHLEKERKWREAMHWLTENWQGLWW